MVRLVAGSRVCDQVEQERDRIFSWPGLRPSRSISAVRAHPVLVWQG